MEKVLVIVGPTGVGKTALSVNMAKQYQGEIISGDSMQVYKEMTIGTAKIKQDEMLGIPHYLIDCYSYKEDYNVKLFQERARSYIQTIHQNKKLPIICGGTGLYVKSAIYDYHFQDQKVDREFMQLLETLSNDQLWSLLKIVDVSACDNLHPNNRQRLVRALYMAHTGSKKSSNIASQTHEPIYDAYIIGLTMDRALLYERINQRVDKMMEEGLFEEVSNLVKSYEDCWNLQSFQGIGYKEWRDYFLGNVDKETCVALIKKNSRNFAKRQYTWFHNQMQVHWYNVTEKDYSKRIYIDIENWLCT